MNLGKGGLGPASPVRARAGGSPVPPAVRSPEEVRSRSGRNYPDSDLILSRLLAEWARLIGGRGLQDAGQSRAGGDAGDAAPLGDGLAVDLVQVGREVDGAGATARHSPGQREWRSRTRRKRKVSLTTWSPSPSGSGRSSTAALSCRRRASGQTCRPGLLDGRTPLRRARTMSRRRTASARVPAATTAAPRTTTGTVSRQGTGARDRWSRITGRRPARRAAPQCRQKSSLD